MSETRIRVWTSRGPVLGSKRRFRLLAEALVVVVIGLATCPTWGRAQEPAPGAEPAEAAELAPTDDSALGEAQPLSLRYKFTQKYTETADPDHPEWLTQYQVGAREKIKLVRDTPQGAPDRAETTLQTIYTERVVKTTPNKAASDMVRRYDQVRLTTTVPVIRHYQNPKLLEQLTLWYRVKPGKPVDLFNLTDGRPLRQLEFDRIIKNPFLPQLATLLPTAARRVGDVWQVPRSTMAVLVGEAPLEEEYDISAELIEVRGAAAGGTSLTAVLGVKGQLLLLDGPVALNARVHFSFEPAKAAAPAPAKGAAAGVVEANGFISEIRMAEVVTVPLDDEGRLKQTRSRELVLACRARASELGAEAALPLITPEAPPDDVAHTWITYDDPDGRFHLAHPQSLRVARAYPEGGLDLVDRRLDGQDVIQLSLVAKTGDASKDRLAADPLEQRKALTDQWKQQGQEVLMGPSGWLNDADWAPLNRKVYRIEAALKPGDEEGAAVRGGRIYLDRYIVQFTRNDTLVVTAMTTRDPHVPFRDLAEILIQSFAFGPSESAPGAAASPATAPSPAPSNTPAP